MTAAHRQQLGQLATDLLGSDIGARRVAALRRALDGTPRASLTLDALQDAPDWLRMPAAARERLGQRAALLAIAPVIAASIDGRWLGALARVAGDAAIDDAIAQAPRLPVRLSRFEATDLPGIGGALLRAAVPAALRDYAAPPLGPDPAIAASTATAAIDLALIAA